MKAVLLHIALLISRRKNFVGYLIQRSIFESGTMFLMFCFRPFTFYVNQTLSRVVIYMFFYLFVCKAANALIIKLIS
jgi:hypothetical protein